jgi:hypothetical protein
VLWSRHPDLNWGPVDYEAVIHRATKSRTTPSLKSAGRNLGSTFPPSKKTRGSVERGVVTDAGALAANDQSMLVHRECGGGEVRHRRLLAAQVPSVGEQVKGREAAVSAGVKWSGLWANRGESLLAWPVAGDPSPTAMVKEASGKRRSSSWVCRLMRVQWNPRNPTLRSQDSRNPLPEAEP